MRSEEELLAELEWYEEWSESDSIDGPCVTSFESEGYLDGLRFALGQDVAERGLPPTEAVNELVRRVESEFPNAEVCVERHGWPPRPDISLHVRDDVDASDAEAYVARSDRVRDLARELEAEYEDEDWMIYTYYDKKRHQVRGR